MIRKKYNARGFTLLEILIALFIFTIIAIIMTHALHNSLDAQAQTEKHAEAFSELQHALLYIERDAEQTINRPIINNKGSQETPILGTPTELKLVHAGVENPNGTLQRSTLQRVSYHLNKTMLVRDTWQALDQTSKSIFQTHTLLHNVKSLHFDYLNDKKSFNEHWPEPNSSQHSPLPRAVRMTLVLKNQGTLEQTYIIPDQTTLTPQQQNAPKPSPEQTSEQPKEDDSHETE